MQTYSCPSCKFHISEADKLWNSAIDSGRCPYCQEPLRNFPVRSKQEETPFSYPPKRQKTWKRISVEDSKKHPLYGVRGWLVFFAFSTLIGFVKDLTDVNAVALKAGVSLGTLLSVDMPEASFVKLALWIHGLIVVAIYGLLFSKHPSFRPVSSYLLLGFWPAVALAGFLNPFSALGELLVFSFILWAVSCAVWVTYLQKSKRVRVTFEHSVKSGHDNVAGTNDHSSERRVQATLARGSKAMSPSQPTANPIALLPILAEQSQTTSEAHEDRLYEQIAQELEANTVDKALWTKAYAHAGGDDKQTRALYIKARFARLLAMQDGQSGAITREQETNL